MHFVENQQNIWFMLQKHIKDVLMKNNDWVYLISINDLFLQDLITTLLLENDILFQIKNNESGDYMNIVAGFSIYGVEVFVYKSDYKKAMDIIDSLPQKEEIDNI